MHQLVRRRDTIIGDCSPLTARDSSQPRDAMTMPARRIIGGPGRVIILGLSAGLAMAILASFLVGGIRWRLETLALAATGRIDGISLREVAPMLVPGSPIYLEALPDTRNAYVTVRNPQTSRTDVEAGQALFQSHCTLCHGADGTGIAGPDLTDNVTIHGTTDWGMFHVISRGVPDTPMPGSELSENERWQLVSFVRSLADPGAAEDATATLPPVRAIPGELITVEAHHAGNWLTYSGNYRGHRFSSLDQINTENVDELVITRVLQLSDVEPRFESSPLAIDGVLFLTEPPNNVIAWDVRTGERRWTYQHSLSSSQLSLCCGAVNRGLAVLDSTLYYGALNATLVALDARTGRIRWEVAVADPSQGYSMTGAPLAIPGRIIVGVGGGEYGIRGFIDAYDPMTGERLWRFWTVPGPGEAGHESWAGDSWRTGGAPTWITGSYDADRNLLYWGVGNPGPNFVGDDRGGDNLYSNSVVALDADDGTLSWHFQFTPHDLHDWDANQVPILTEASDGTPLLLSANRNAFFYVLNRETGRFLRAAPFAHQTWAAGIDSDGRPLRLPNTEPSVEGTFLYPGVSGGTNWWSPSFSPETSLFYVPALDAPSIFFRGRDSPEHVPGDDFQGGASPTLAPGTAYRTSIRAIDPSDASIAWEHAFPPRTSRPLVGGIGGLLSTAGGLVFVGDNEIFYALDAVTGEERWRAYLGGRILAAPITFEVDARQHVTVIAGHSMFVFALR